MNRQLTAKQTLVLKMINQVIKAGPYTLEDLDLLFMGKIGSVMVLRRGSYVRHIMVIFGIIIPASDWLKANNLEQNA